MTTTSQNVAPVTTGPILSRHRRVRMVDTDTAKLIYFATVYRWAESMFTDWLAAIGRPLSTILEDDIGLPAVRSEAEYLHPLGLDDQLDMQLRANHVGDHSFSLLTTGYLLPDRTEAVRIRIWHAYVEMEAVPGTRTPRVRVTELPQWLRDGLAFREDDA